MATSDKMPKVNAQFAKEGMGKGTASVKEQKAEQFYEGNAVKRDPSTAQDQK